MIQLFYVFNIANLTITGTDQRLNITHKYKIFYTFEVKIKNYSQIKANIFSIEFQY